MEGRDGRRSGRILSGPTSGQVRDPGARRIGERAGRRGVRAGRRRDAAGGAAGVDALPVAGRAGRVLGLAREPMVTVGAVDRGTKEAVAAAVSVANICPYCADMHTVGMYDLSGEHAAEAVGGDRVQDIAEPALRAAVAWARSAHQLDEAAPPPAGLSPPIARSWSGWSSRSTT
ncbi:carboxymuconolactone decarboxylase family protein [Micromonospora sp. M12]